MSFRKRLVLLFLLVLLAGALTALCAPFAVAHGVRAWLWWVARSENLTIEAGKIEAPFLGGVTIDELHVASQKTSGREVDLRLSQVMLDLNFRGWIFAQRARFMRTIAAGHVRGSFHRAPNVAARKFDWRKFEQLLPDNIRLDDVNLEITTATTAVTLRGVVLTASEIESGKFFASEIFVSSPILRQTFTGLRGATSWENARLTIAGLTLARGLDLQSVTLDLSRLKARHFGIDFHLDTFGGTLRASLQARAGKKFGIDLAGSASNISLAQISQAAGLLEPVTGRVRASKFTFRGRPGEFFDATASIWIELADFAWRARRADMVMLGATYYNRRLEVDQLYLRQRQNELTVNGELLWPSKLPAWSQLQFRGQLNASLPDLNAFAQLFGATTGDFAGTLAAEGDFDSLDREPHGRLALRGQGVSYRGLSFDSLGASLQLRGTEMTLEKLEVRHENDFLYADGSVDLKAPHRYSTRWTGALNDLAAYTPLLPAARREAKAGGGVTFDWHGDGTVAAHSGTLQVYARGIQLPVAPLRAPLDLTLEGTYSPQDFFLRNLRLTNGRFSLGGFLMLGSNFIELQALEVALDGTPRIDGTLFLPLSADRFRKSRSWFEAFDEQQKFDVDLAVHHLDLAQLAAALGEKSDLTGVLDGKLAAYGPLQSLQLTTNWHLENLGPASSKNSIDFNLRCAGARAEAESRLIFGASDPVVWRTSVPLRLEKKRVADGSFIEPDGWLFFALDCPALFPETLPAALRPFGVHGGFVSGGIAVVNTLREPQISGQAQFSALRLNHEPPWPAVADLAGQIYFSSRQAEIARLQFSLDGTALAFHGSLTTTAPDSFSIRLTPENAILFAALPASGESISTVRLIGEGSASAEESLRELFVRGKIGSAVSSLTIDAQPPEKEEGSFAQTTLFLGLDDPEAKPLLLQLAAPPETSPKLELTPAAP